MEIKDLSKEELLSLIYHNMDDTYRDIHPCYCGSCGKGHSDQTIDDMVLITFRDGSTHPVTAYGYLCDECEAKIKQFPRKLKVFIDYEMKRFLDYVINKYGKDFIKLYEI